MNSKKHMANILIAGGSGQWCRKNHLAALLRLKHAGVSLRIVAIVDFVNPYAIPGKEPLQELLKMDNPVWINAKTSRIALIHSLNELYRTTPLEMLIISTDPVFHYFYLQWGVKHSINILCDKPLIVFPNSASNVHAAQSIHRSYVSLCNKVREIKKIHPDYALWTPLRRRALTPFVDIAKNIEEIYTKFNAGITHMNVIIN